LLRTSFTDNLGLCSSVSVRRRRMWTAHGRTTSSTRPSRV